MICISVVATLSELVVVLDETEKELDEETPPGDVVVLKVIGPLLVDIIISLLVVDPAVVGARLLEPELDEDTPPGDVVVLGVNVLLLLDDIISSSLVVDPTVVVCALLLDGVVIDDDELCCEVEIGSVVNKSVVTFS